MTYITHYCEWEYKKGVTCSNPLTERVYNYSMGKYAKPLCFGHQVQHDKDNSFASQKDYEESTFK